MLKNPVTLLIVLIFLYPIVKGVIFKINYENLKSDLSNMEKTLSFLISFPIWVNVRGLINRFMNTVITKLPYNITYYVEEYSKLYLIIVFLISIYLIYKFQMLIYIIINKLLFNPIIISLKDKEGYRKPWVNRVIAMIISIPKGVFYALLITSSIHALSYFYQKDKFQDYVQRSKLYNDINKNTLEPVINSKFLGKIPNTIKNSFKVEVKYDEHNITKEKGSKSNTLVYYNGVTLEDGIKSNNVIDEFSVSLTKGHTSDKAKAKVIYNFIGSNIDYDYEKADNIYTNNFKIEFGVIPTYDTKRGICFDFSCLFVAMCRANNLKVRLVTGEGYNGVNWVSHSWNEVYINEEDKWINIDTTFYKGGNYFNSKRFDLDHRGENIVGEW